MKVNKWTCEKCGKENQTDDPFYPMAPITHVTCECGHVHQFQVDLHMVYYGTPARRFELGG